MAQKAIREFDAKNILGRHWHRYFAGVPGWQGLTAQVGPGTDLRGLPALHPWLLDRPLAVKPDVLAGRRGKHGLILLGADWPAAESWLRAHAGRQVEIGGITGILSHFIIEPFVTVQAEHYASITTERDADVILYSARGGVEVERHLDVAHSWRVPVLEGSGWPDFAAGLAAEMGGEQATQSAAFLAGLHRFFVDLNFTYLEVNPLAVTSAGLVPLDLKCRLDDAAQFESGELWGRIEFPPPFGRRTSAAEDYVAELDSHSGASLKLTILNPAGRIWTLVAGGGASVIYTDTIADLGFAGQLANYGEYSGNPSADETYEYARTIIGLMTETAAPPGLAKHLIIGGGIANFTDVAETFTGIIRAMREYAEPLRRTPVRVYVRRGGPNAAAGLDLMRRLGEEIGVAIAVHGPEMHMTRVVSLALAAEGGVNRA